MFERFTERSRKVIVLAQDEAVRLKHDYIGTEHLLLGLIHEREGVAAQALDALGVTLDEAREQVEAIVGYGDETTTQAPFTPRSKNVLEASLKEAMGMGHNYIGTEHLLLGLLSDPEGVAAIALSNLGADPEKIRQEVLSRLGKGLGSGPRGDLGPLGWAREALQRSFGRYPRAEDRASFERFTQLGRRVVVLAQDEARHFNHNYIGTEHILLGLVREEDGIAARVLRKLGVDLDETREQVESIVGYGEEGTGAQAPFTPRTNKVLQLALRESLQLGHDYVSTEHVLLGLVREGEGVAARVLSNLDVDLTAIRSEVLEMVTEDQADVSGPYLGIEPFRTRIGKVDVRARYGKDSEERAERRLLYIDLDIVHEALGLVDADVLTDSLRRALEPVGFTVLESLVERVGQHVLEALPVAEQVTVTVTRDPATGGLPEVSVARTFKRW